MRTLSTTSLGILFFISYSILSAAEYGGRWTDESIREHSLEYIETTKLRFSERAARISEVTGSSFEIEYRELTPEQQKYYEKFLEDRISDSHREGLMRMILKDLESVRVKIAEAEAAAFKKWENLPKSGQGAEANTVEGTIYGTEVSASNLGVVLDNSPSMQPYLEAVRSEISKSFPSAQFREAAGSGLFVRNDYRKLETAFPESMWFYAELPSAGKNPFDPKWHQHKIFDNIQPHYQQVRLERDPLAALVALAELQEVDALYWFCDFEDDIDGRAFQLLKKAIETNEVAFYVHSSNRRPKKEIADLAEASGGEVIRKRIR